MFTMNSIRLSITAFVLLGMHGDFRLTEKEKYVGSTTCNEEFRQALKIPEATTCEFIKWELEINSNDFRLRARYGESQPNTNGFKQNGHAVDIAGTVSVTKGAQVGSTYSVIHLTSRLLAVELTLVRMNESLLHFSNSRSELLIGN